MPFEVTSLSTKFKGNTLIETFNELVKFGVRTLGGDVFDSCTNLASVNTTNITSVSSGSASGNGYSPFGYSKVTRIELPNITSIGNYIGVNLSAVWVLGENLSTVYQYSFRTMSSGARSSTYLIYATTPPTLASGTASAANFTGYIYVPDESYDDYIASSSWSPIKAKIRKMSAYTG